MLVAEMQYCDLDGALVRCFYMRMTMFVRLCLLIGSCRSYEESVRGSHAVGKAFLSPPAEHKASIYTAGRGDYIRNQGPAISWKGPDSQPPKEVSEGHLVSPCNTALYYCKRVPGMTAVQIIPSIDKKCQVGYKPLDVALCRLPNGAPNEWLGGGSEP